MLNVFPGLSRLWDTEHYHGLAETTVYDGTSYVIGVIGTMKSNSYVTHLSLLVPTNYFHLNLHNLHSLE